MIPRALMMRIMDFAYSDEDEWEVASRELTEWLRDREPSENEVDQFEIDYVFSRKHSQYDKTFVRLFVECFEEIYGKEWSKDIIRLEENFGSYFEILNVGENSIAVKDLILEDVFEVTPFYHYNPHKGDIIHGTLFPWRKMHFFFGPLELYDEEEAKNGVLQFAENTRETYEHITTSFLEYFGKNVVIFEDFEGMEEKLNKFIYWFFTERVPAGVLTEEEKENPRKISFSEFEGRREIGLVIDYSMGQILIPEYGYAAKIFSGKWEEVPDYEDRVHQMLYEDQMPAYFVQEMIEENPECSVELYAQFFPHVKTKSSLLELFAKCRRDWGRVPRRHGPVFEDYR